MTARYASSDPLGLMGKKGKGKGKAGGAGCDNNGNNSQNDGKSREDKARDAMPTIANTFEEKTRIR